MEGGVLRLQEVFWFTCFRIASTFYVLVLFTAYNTVTILFASALSAPIDSSMLEEKKLVKFVELLVHDYLQVKGFQETGAKFAEECSKAGGAGGRDDGPSLDEADSWYCLADKLSLPEILRHNSMAAEGRRFSAVIEVLVQEMVREGQTRSHIPSSVSMVSLRDPYGKRQHALDQTASTLDCPHPVVCKIGKGSSGDVALETTAAASEISDVTLSKETIISPEEGLSTNLLAVGGGGGCSNANEAVREATGKERCKKSRLQSMAGGSRSNLGVRSETRDVARKQVPSNAKRLHGYSSPPKGGRRLRDSSGVLNKFQFSKDAMRRQQMSHESWIPMDLRLKMMRRSMVVIKENVHESVAQDTLVRKEKKRSNRSELEIVKTQEKFGTKHQRPCALCEQSFSEVNLVLAVPFKAIVDLRIAWQKTLPQVKGTTTKTNRTMLMPPQCYNEVKVCAFCSQLFHDPLGYRPTWDMEVLSMRKKRERLAREKDREYWDPLRKATQLKDQEAKLPTDADHNVTPPPLAEAGA